jgi:hypothetical protein
LQAACQTLDPAAESGTSLPDSLVFLGGFQGGEAEGIGQKNKEFAATTEHGMPAYLMEYILRRLAI